MTYFAKKLRALFISIRQQKHVYYNDDRRLHGRATLLYVTLISFSVCDAAGAVSRVARPELLYVLDPVGRSAETVVLPPVVYDHRTADVTKAIFAACRLLD